MMSQERMRQARAIFAAICVATLGLGLVGCGESPEEEATRVQAELAGLTAQYQEILDRYKPAVNSQEDLRNAFNNGLPCIASPEFVAGVRTSLADERSGTPDSAVTGDEVTVDFRAGILTFRGASFGFPALGSVPQGLIAAGGIEAQVRRRFQD